MADVSRERELRVELAQTRALNAELRQACVLFQDRVEALERLRVKLTEHADLLMQAQGLHERENQLLRDRVAELERQLGQNPRNSHRPPSSQGYERPAPKSRRERTDRDPGGQIGHEGTTLRQVDVPDRVQVHPPPRCGCGRSLRRAPVVSVEVRQVFDLPEIALEVTEHRIEHRRCVCGQRTMGPVPAGVGAPTQYGPGVRALGTYLLAGQHLPLARCSQLLSDVLGAPVSQGSLASWYAQGAADLDGFDEGLRQGLAAAPVLGADETGIRVEGKLAWVHAARTDALTRYTVSHRRGVEAMRAAGVLANLAPGTVLVSDFWAPYWQFDQLIHAVCGAHLGRELVAAAEVDGQGGWAEPMDRLLAEINRTATAARRSGADRLAPALLATYRRRYTELITAGWQANPAHHRGGRGQQRRPKHVNLLDRLDTHRDEVLRYCDDLRVPFTNNGSEQDIRPLKIRMKIAGCLRSMTGAEAFCRLRSYLSTGRKQGQPAFAIMRALFEGHPWIPTAAA